MSDAPEKPTTEADPAAATRLRRMQWAGAAVTSLVILLAGAVLYQRGTSVVAKPAVPTDAEQPAVCELVASEGDTRLYCSRVVAAEPEVVWKTVTDYQKFPELFDSLLWTMKFDTVEKTPAGTHIVGKVDSVVGRWPIDVVMRHESKPNIHRAKWDASEDYRVNRGGWTITPSGTNTLLVYEIDVRSRVAPSFLVRNALLDQVPHIMDAVDEGAKARAEQ